MTVVAGRVLRWQHLIKVPSSSMEDFAQCADSLTLPSDLVKVRAVVIYKQWNTHAQCHLGKRDARADQVPSACRR